MFIQRNIKVKFELEIWYRHPRLRLITKKTEVKFNLAELSFIGIKPDMQEDIEGYSSFRTKYLIYANFKFCIYIKQNVNLSCNSMKTKITSVCEQHQL